MVWEKLKNNIEFVKVFEKNYTWTSFSTFLLFLAFHFSILRGESNIYILSVKPL